MMPISEADLQDTVIGLAHLYGWTVAHFRPARTRDGWRTPVAADGKGFPDLICIRGRDLLVVELTSQRGRLTAEQEMCLDLFTRAEAITTRLWRPDDWPEIEETLQR